MSTSLYPVRVDARLEEEHLSRWLWLVKWLLAIPHYLVLALLWVAFVVLSAVALVAIVVTGRYPRSIFDFNVGVLRWTWRVSFYAYGSLGTDRYPPFSLDERPDYPAHLDVAYPQHLSRGLALVKWWLLAIPHYLLIALFTGGGWYVARGHDDPPGSWSPGLIGLLVLVAAVVLLFTGRYPRTIFDLVLGLNRWVLRVAGYAALMTDEYPPFRLDQGGTDPGTGALALGTPPTPGSPPTSAALSGPGPSNPGATAGWGTAEQVPPPPAAGPPTPPVAGPPPPPPPGARRATWGAGRIIAVLLGALLALTSFALLAGGAVLLVADNALRDDAGYLMSPSETYTSPGAAVTSHSIVLHSGPAVDVAHRWLGTVRITAESRAPGAAFVGVGRSGDVTRYLAGVAHSVVADPSGSDGAPDTTYVDGATPRLDPAGEQFWAASATGNGRQALTWEPRDGSWTVVVMNADGAAPVRADVAAGAEVPGLDEVGVGLLVSGGVLLAVSALVLVLAVRRPMSATG
jgi:hypothetical protein